MKTYGQFCPVAKAAEIFCERWTALIIRDLASGATRFSQLQRGVSLASPSLLARRLKQLQAEGIIERRKAASGLSWTYHLTPAGREFVPLIEGLGIWGQRWTRRQLAEHEINLDLLLWAMEGSVHPQALAGEATVVELEFTDQPKAKQRWWFRNEHGRAELCLKEPDQEVDLWVRTTLKDMILIWRGDVELKKALHDGLLRVQGKGAARKAVGQWLGVSSLADVHSQRPDAGADGATSPRG